MGASLVAGLASAGVGMAVNLNSAIDCERTAVRLRASAKDKRENARRRRQFKEELELNKSNKEHQLMDYKKEIGIYFPSILFSVLQMYTCV